MENQPKTEPERTSLAWTQRIQNGEITPKEAFETIKIKETAEWLEGMPRRIRYNRKTFIYNTVFILGTSISIALSLRTLAMRGILAPNVLYVLSFCLLIVPICLMTVYNKMSSRHIDTCSATLFAGVRAVGPLLEALNLPQTTGQEKEIRAALVLLLPQMKASDTLLLNREQRSYLNMPLFRFYQNHPLWQEDPDYCIAILKALEQVGDRFAISYVELLATMKTKNLKRLNVKRAAIECLPMLQANCGNVEANKSLLRASQTGAFSPETLLRAASSGTETAPHQLLRAAQTGEDAKR